jgi:hypothetical protein
VVILINKTLRKEEKGVVINTAPFFIKLLQVHLKILCTEAEAQQKQLTLSRYKFNRSIIFFLIIEMSALTLVAMFLQKELYLIGLFFSKVFC